MEYQEILSMSWNGISSHRLRTFLTILGIIFGVAAVVSMLSIGAGAKKQALDQIRLLGVNNIILHSEPVTFRTDDRGTVMESMGLTIDDARSLMTLNPLIAASVPQRVLQGVRVTRKSEEVLTVIVGTTPDLQNVLSYLPVKGNFFNYKDVHEARRVCVLGSKIKRNLFFYEEAVGQSVKIGNLWFTVVGVMESKPRSTGRGGVGDRDLNMDIYIPLSSSVLRFSQDPTQPEVEQIILKVHEEDRIMEAAHLANSLISLRHGGAQDYRLVVPEELMRQSQKTQQIFNIVMGAIAGISLLVGGIGIMNIMLATVMERTREIGVRRAIGATRKDVLSQFLIESVLLSFSGGLIGILLGFIMTKLISTYANWTTIVEWTSIVLAFSVSAAVGIIFGIYPARKAAMLDPIESLRYE